MSHKCYMDKCCACGKKRDGLFGLKDSWITVGDGHNFHKQCLLEDMLFKFIGNKEYLVIDNFDEIPLTEQSRSNQK